MSSFTITSEVHAGADTILYRGLRVEDQAKITIKLPRSQHPSERDIEKLRYEYLLLRDLNLPEVVRPYGLEKHEGALGLVLEDLGGETLAEIERSRRLDLAEALTIAAGIAEALDAIHRRRVIHKDINPRNIVVAHETGRVRLIDFGLACRLSHEDHRAVRPSALEGTLAYMSPEQTGRMNRSLDHRADLYSLGVTLYEMLTGGVPFPGDDPMELVHSHVAKRPAPPRELSREIPVTVSDLVMKLLAKAAEDRYKSAAGLALDLRECGMRLARDGEIAPFPLGRRDFSGELCVPQKLYGREAEVLALLDAFARTIQGRPELILVMGSAGVGKSVLVNEIHKPITQHGGAFISGKFDQLNRGVPYAPIAHAFRDLCRGFLTGSTEALHRLRDELLGALGQSGQVLIDLIPELALILGPQPPVPELGPSESQNRFALAFQSAAAVLATREHPIALFLDDLQWADPASLKLLEILLTSPDSAHLLLIGAYRDNEVDAGHPLSLSLAELQKAGARIREISLRPLDLPTVTEICVETLGCDGARAAPLAELIFAKTAGNPLFMNQLLGTLHQQGLLTFRADDGAWEWNIGGILSAGIADNVVDFMVAKIQRLDKEAQRILTLAACIGHTFDLKTLSIIHEASEAATAATLWDALQEGLVVPLSSEYRFRHPPEIRGADPLAAPSGLSVSYRFLHDRVQQAAYSFIEETSRQEVHLRIGRLLLASREATPDDDDVMDAVHHLNLGARLITDRRELLSLARLDLATGKRAKRATAYDLGANTFAAGAAALGDLGWTDAYDLTFELSAEQAECEYLSHRLEEAEALFNDVLHRARTKAQRAQIENQRIILYGGIGKIFESVAVGRRALAELGIDLPEAPEQFGPALEAALAEVAVNLGGRRIEDLVDAPRMTDPERAIALKILSNVFSSAYIVSPVLLALVAAMQANLNLKHGHSETSPFGYVVYGLVLSTMGRYEEAYAFGRLALALGERFHSVELASKLHVVFGMNINYCQKPLRSSLPHYSAALSAGLTNGDLIFMSFAAIGLVTSRLAIGEHLDGVREEASRLLVLVRRLRYEASEVPIALALQFIASLLGETRSLSSLEDDDFNEAKFLSLSARHHMANAACYYHSHKTHLLLLAEDYEGALAHARDADSLSWAATGYYFLIDLAFHSCLLLLLTPAPPADDGGAREASYAKHKALIDRLAASCPENFQHKRLLINAEEARARGEGLLAMDLYDQAIAAARVAKFSQDEALASELAAKFYRELGREAIERTYLSSASAAYQTWGATAKCRLISERYKTLTPPQAASTRGAVTIDLLTVIKASEAISGEIDLSRLLTELMTIALENAGAERGTLLRVAGEGLHVEAEAAVDHDTVKVERPAAGAARVALPDSILNYVRRTRESVVLHDAAEEARFSSDPVIAATRPKSVLCLPLLRQSALVGMLYLENNLTRGAFTPERIELLRVLSTQAAISLENAVLYHELSQENAERRRAEQEVRTLNAELERRVEERTAQLAETNKELEAFSYSVSHDLRTPLRSIEGFSRAILEDFSDTLPADAQELLGRVRKASLRMGQLIEDLLTLSRVTSAEMTTEAVNLSAIAQEIAADLMKSSPARDVSFVVADGLTVNGDEKLLRIALENLLGNAFKFTSKHSAARIEFGVHKDPHGKMAYFVRDDGAGFDMKWSAKLFGAFQRMHTPAEFAGTGVGLSTVRRVVHRHGGRIWAESAPEQGATFYFTL